MDADDLAVISAHVQDAEVRVADIVWRPGEKRLVIGMSRLDWDQTIAGTVEPRRLVSALRFDRVLACKFRDIDLEGGDVVLKLLGIEFNEPVAPLRQKLLYDKHIFTGVAGQNMIRLLAPLCLTKAEADRFLEAFNEVIA